MAYQFSDLKTKLRTQIGDPSLDTTVMADAINYTIQSIFNSIEITLNSSYQSNTVAAGANTLTTALPTDLQKITALYITGPVGRESDLTDYFVSPKEFRAQFPSVTISNPLSYWTFWTGVEFSTLADVAHTVRIEYTKSVPILSADADVPALPEAYEELLVLGAKMRIYEQKEDFDYAGQFQTRYADLLESFLSRYSTRQIDGQFVIPGPRQSITRIR
jgi:hypothetical protein